MKNEPCDQWLVGPEKTILEVRRCDCDINPSADYTPACAELFWYDSSLANPQADEWTDEKCYYTPQYLSQTAIAIDKKEAIVEVINIAAKKTFLSFDEYRQEQTVSVSDTGLRG